jgi:hypothetical protein
VAALHVRISRPKHCKHCLRGCNHLPVDRSYSHSSNALRDSAIPTQLRIPQTPSIIRHAVCLPAGFITRPCVTPALPLLYIQASNHVSSPPTILLVTGDIRHRPRALARGLRTLDIYIYQVVKPLFFFSLLFSKKTGRLNELVAVLSLDRQRLADIRIFHCYIRIDTSSISCSVA